MGHGDVDYAGKKPQRSRCQRICRAIYNPDKHQLFGRTCGSWAKIGLFYGVYYALLAGFFAAMMFGFFTTVDEKSPTQKGMHSLIKSNPGMGFRPLEATDSTLIKYNMFDVTTYHKKIENIIQFLRENNYIDEKNQPKTDIDKDSNGKPVFDFVSNCGECCIDPKNVNNSFGYADGTPCVLLKVNRVYGWSPEAFDNASLDSEHGKEAKKLVGDNIINKVDGENQIAVTCEGENDGDIDVLGKVDLFPATGFSYSYFPYLNADGYRPPLVFAKFSNLEKKVLVQVWCKLWAANIKIHKNDKAGSCRFELQIDAQK